MYKCAVFSAMALLAGTLLAAEPKDQITNAAKALADKDNYSWTSEMEMSRDGQQFRPGPTNGKTEKGGFTTLSMTRGDNTIQAVVKDGKGALKMGDDWQSLAEVADGDGGQNRGRWVARMLRNLKTPAVEAQDIVKGMNQIKEADGAFTGDLTEDGAKALMLFGARGANAPAVSNAKGSAKFWLKDGALAKYQYTVKGNVTFNNNEAETERTTTVEIKDVGSTKVDVSDEAKKKIG